MACGDAGKEVRWPGPVTFDDDTPNSGYATVHLTIPNMTIKKKLGGTDKPKNATMETLSYDNDVVLFRVTVTDGDKPVCYEYKKALPEKVVPNLCKFKVEKEIIRLILAKEKKESWSQHQRHFIERPKT